MARRRTEATTPGGKLQQPNPSPNGAAARILGAAKKLENRSPKGVLDACPKHQNSPTWVGQPLFHPSLPRKFKNPKFQIRSWNSAIVSSKTKKIYIQPCFTRDGELFGVDPVSKEEVEVPFKEVRSLIVNRPKRVLNFKDILKKRGICIYHVNVLKSIVPVLRPIDAHHLYAARDLMASESTTPKLRKKETTQPKKARLNRPERIEKRKQYTSAVTADSKIRQDCQKVQTQAHDPKKIYESIEVARVASCIRNQNGLIDLMRYQISKFKPSHLAAEHIRSFKIMLGPCPDNEALIDDIFSRFYPNLSTLDKIEILHTACTPEKQSQHDSSVSHSTTGNVSFRESRVIYNCGCVAESIFTPPTRDVRESINTDICWIRRCSHNAKFESEMARSKESQSVVSRRIPTCVGMLGFGLAKILAREYKAHIDNFSPTINRAELLRETCLLLQDNFNLHEEWPQNLGDDDKRRYAIRQVLMLFDPRSAGERETILFPTHKNQI